jgi:hypothetical protein
MDRELSAKARAMLDARGVKPTKAFPHERPKWKTTDADLRMFERIAKGEELSETVNVTLAAPHLATRADFSANGALSWQAMKDRKCSLIAKWRSNGASILARAGRSI